MKLNSLSQGDKFYLGKVKYTVHICIRPEYRTRDYPVHCMDYPKRSKIHRFSSETSIKPVIKYESS